MKLDWNGIDTVLLDMDGTLLDRHFDDHFWLEHVPKRYAAQNGIPLDEAKKLLYALFRSQERTLNWTDLDYWSERLGLDIPVLKQEIDHLIAVHPGVVEFLVFLRRHGKQAWLVTNAHGKTLSLKMRKTRLGPYFTGIISAHDLGLPKEDVRFWEKLQERVPYEPSRTLLGEDSETNLGTAEEYGIAHLIYVSRYSSTVTPTASDRYASIHYFTQLIPAAHTDET
ncbi:MULTISPECIES: GMP/IMP nucleotidase [Geobacter]|uniref:HAD superfamily hydrolase n=1 Tax=Geobacter sulfurreducens (strain ATCC 51573 / DSM 12127 / PCA) TaxID=243231 RepID=Q74CH9_GEOSL|nr:GMP/IMP nucleotidase [Geobacter sulfurreducens]BET58084.1 GMP/IMP nucleotidase [Geobacter sp. 60473]AAR35072.1 HAD superfamily hydrolase [Geobacter sulfurreducens PCA]ADI84528.1 HAD superfamily hydrolase [Geobacter sulfurreducens KN400]AJY71425.1 haloacid dehalogenase [Geobacter sulfurreducens]UAC05689.1 GMP/IMP nucleotidase [Geobacter sulfurreducens]